MDQDGMSIRIVGFHWNFVYLNEFNEPVSSAVLLLCSLILMKFHKVIEANVSRPVDPYMSVVIIFLSIAAKLIVWLHYKTFGADLKSRFRITDKDVLIVNTHPVVPYNVLSTAIFWK